ncbi:MAG: alpha/beta hydrolase [Gemmatimonadetes bacterium]|nr:alpha/beta hydrolase [Gemmatimonadota bacterium]
MTLFLNLRTQNVGGSVVDPYLLDGDATVSPPALRAVNWAEIAPLVEGRNVLFVTHGFNVSYQDGARSLAMLGARLACTDSELFIGVLWPGDWWLPVVNYPFEGEVAIDCGRRVAAFAARWMAGAQSISLASHSLGARVVLETAERLSQPARSLTVTAGAVNHDCLATQYADAASNAVAVSVLASQQDWVLKLAFRIGDPISELLRDDHSPFQPALGYDGPHGALPDSLHGPWQIPPSANYGHGSYLPPSNGVDAPGAKWHQVADYIGRAWRGEGQGWP